MNCIKCSHVNDDDARFCESCGAPLTAAAPQTVAADKVAAAAVSPPLSPEAVQYHVSFGSAFAVDQFGFVRKGVVAIDSKSFAFIGKKGWSFVTKFFVFLLVSIIPAVLVGIGIGPLVALVIIHYFCASSGELSIDRASIIDIQRNGRLVKFRGRHPLSGKLKKSVFKVDSELNAAALENALTGSA